MDSIKTHLTITLLLCILLPSCLIGGTTLWLLFSTIKEERIKSVGEVAQFRYERLREHLLQNNQRGSDLLHSVLADCRESDFGVNICAKTRLEQFFIINHPVGMSLHSGVEEDMTVGSEAISIQKLKLPFPSGQIAVMSKSVHSHTKLYSFVVQDKASGFSLVTTYSAEALKNIFINSSMLGESGETFLADSEGFFITNPRYLSEQGVIKPISAKPMQHCLSKKNGRMLDFDYRNERIIHGFRYVPEIGGGCIMAHISQAEAFKPLLHLLLAWLTGTFLFIGIAWQIAKAISANMTQPIAALVRMAQDLTQHNFIPRIISSKFQEISQLGQSLNQMASELDNSLRQLKESERDLEQKVIERTEALEKRRRRYQSVIETSADGFWRTDTSGWLLEVNPAYERLSNYSQAELLTMHISDLEAQEKIEETNIHIQKVIQQGWDIFETKHRRKDGSLWDAEVNASFVSADDGYFVCFFRDITERKQLQMALIESEALLRNIMDASQTVIYMKDLQGRYLHINKRYQDIFQLSKEMIIGKTDYQLFSQEIADNFRKNDLMVIGSGQPVETEEQALHADNAYHTYLSVKVPLHNSAGEVYAMCGISTDITERKKLEEDIKLLSESELNKAKLEAERANQVKSDFLASMSHELFTPMNAVLGFAQLLEYEDLTEEQHSYVETILRGAHHLLDLIKEVLAFSIIDSEKIDLKIEKVELAGLIQSCLVLTQPLAMQKKVTTIDTLTAACNVTVLADSLRLKQVLLNLISNAVKYNRENGNVKLQCELLNPQTIKISVIDTGIGLTEEQMAKLFQPFERLSAKNSAIEGAGLGLSISKKLIETMNGKIGVESKIGDGCCFWLEIPLA
jgi:PAS domain S-box-containing protein